MLKGRTALQAKIDALAQMPLGNAILRESVDQGRHVLGRKPGRGDQQADGQIGRRLTASADLETAGRQGHGPQERSRLHHRPAPAFDLTAQGVHVAVAVEDAALRRQQRRHRVQARFHGHGLGAGQGLHAFDVVGLGLATDRLEPLDLGVLGRHHQLAALAVGDVVGVQEGVEGASAGDAETGLERSGGIVEPAVHDLGIARGDALPDGPLLLQHNNGQASPGQGVAAGQAHGARADHAGVEIEVAHGLSLANDRGDANQGRAC